MDVTVYYTDGYDPAPGGVERITTPLESGWDRWRVCFRSDEEEPDVWSLSMERWFKHPEGSVAHEYTGPLAKPARFKSEGGQSMPRAEKPLTPTEVKVRKPSGGGHDNH